MNGKLCDYCWTYFTTIKCPYCYPTISPAKPKANINLPLNKCLSPGKSYTKLYEAFDGKYIAIICDTGEKKVLNRELFL